MISSTASPDRADVLLISMPFGPLQMPSIGLGLLKAALLQRGIGVRDLYFTLDMAARIGVEAYTGISLGLHSTTDLLGEWIFERELNGDDPARELAYLEQVIAGAEPVHSKHAISAAVEARPPWMDHLIELRDQRSFLDACLEEVLSHAPRLVGFTSAFQQNIASLALARRIKQAAPQTILCMGGSNCEGVMAAELMRQFPFLDAVVSGEGDIVFPEFASAVLNSSPLPSFPGLHLRQTGSALPVLQQSSCSTPAVTDLDALPVPDYSGYFERFERIRLDHPVHPHVLFESSRGCYWGAVSHCTFCGLNGGTMSYRAKSAARALDEFTTLVAQYPGAPVTVVDNILSMDYFRDFVPQLAARSLDLNICYEVKANLSKEQVRQLARAGIRTIQPGIESLSTPILRLMKKGCTRLQNIQLLKYCRELGVHPIWNILWGFPHEDPADYTAMAELLPQLAHLEPPQSAAALRLDRFSPLFDAPQQSGCTDVRPYPSYGLVYALPEPALRNLAYYFCFNYADGRRPDAYAAPLKQAVDQWRQQQEDFFFALDNTDCLLLIDLRRCATQTFHALTGVDRLLYLACDSMQGLHSLERLLLASGFAFTKDEIRGRLDRLVSQGLMLHEGNQWLALAIAAGEYNIPRAAIQRACRAAKALEREDAETPGRWIVAHLQATPPLSSAASTTSRENGACLLSGAHVHLLASGDVLLDTRDFDSRQWQETRKLWAGVPVR